MSDPTPAPLPADLPPLPDDPDIRVGVDAQIAPYPVTKMPPLPENVAVFGRIIPGPDGRPLPVLQIVYGMTSVDLGITPDLCDRLAQIIPAVLTRVAAEVRRINTGLILPGDPGAQIPPLANGAGPS